MARQRASAAAAATTEEPEVKKPETGTAVAAPAQRSLGGVNARNAFEAYGDQASQRSIVGTLLKFSKGDWIAGEDEDVETETEFLVNMDQLMVGWIKWVDNKPVEQIMGPVAEGFQPPRRNTLGDEDQDGWEVDPTSGQPRDPWQFSNYVLFQAIGNNDCADEGEIFTFATSSRGGLGAIGELCKVYGKEMRTRPDEYPVVSIETSHYQHAKYGRTYVPILKVVGWKPKADFDSSSAEAPVEEASAPTKKDTKKDAARAGGKKK